jgi:glycosyltransferase involved in cell wall biosynthesis
MRIMIVTDQYPPMVGGVPSVTHNLAVDMTGRGHDVLVIAPSADTNSSFCHEDTVAVYRFASFEWPWYAGQRIAFLPLLAMRELIKHIRPDVIHVHSPIVLGPIALLLARSFHIPLIATNHFMPGNMNWTLASNRRFYESVYAYLSWFYNRCTFITAPSRTAVRVLREHGLTTPAKAISNGIDLHTFKPGKRDSAIRRKLNIPEHCPLILYVGRLSEEKRLDVLLEAVTQMRSSAHVALAGTGPLEAELRTQAAELHIEADVSFLGFVSDDDLLTLRQNADVFAIPSEAELQSLATMEAMACGLPIIAANAWALPELVAQNTNGLLFQPGSSDELAHELDMLLSNVDLRHRMGVESRKLIAIHDRTAVLDQWEELYRSMMHVQNEMQVMAK